MGEWLETNGRAIYETRPWLAYGEGPTSRSTWKAVNLWQVELSSAR